MLNWNRQLRDLTWAVNSPSLLVDGPDVPKLDPQQVDPDHLAAFLNESPGRRVGRYFERLILYWLKHIRRVQIIADSMQIRDGDRTVGEIDLLFVDEQRRLTHWEIAVKFYLFYSEHSVIGSHFIGPNAADTFERKMERLFGHQLLRSEAYFPDVEVRQAFVKGRIFYHPSNRTQARRPQQLSAEHLSCQWIRSSQHGMINSADGVSYRILHKPNWLSDEVASDSDSDLHSPASLVAYLKEHFATDNRPVLVSQLAPAGAGFAESERIFVVSDSWPSVTGERA